MQIIFTSIFWKPFLNFYPFLLLYNYLKLVLSYQNLSFLRFQENFKDKPPFLLLHYSDYNHLLKWWINLQCYLLPPNLKPMRQKVIPGSHMILIHGWCEISMMRCHEHQACENWIHLSKCTPHRKYEHCSTRMNSSNWSLVCCLKPKIKLLLQVRWNKAIPGSHCWYRTIPNIMSTKYRSWK